MKPPSDSGKVLRAFARSLNLESHAIIHRPQLLWQQMYNRLQWEPDPISTKLSSEFAIRTAPGATPWLRSRSPVTESRELARILGGHDDGISGLAFTPDGRRLVSIGGGLDESIRVWDVSSGSELMRIDTSIYDGAGVDISPDAKWIVSIGDGTSADTKTLQFWDLETGARLSSVEAVFRGGCVECSPDGHRVAVGGWGKSAKSWRNIGIDNPDILINPTEGWDLAFSPDSRQLASLKRNAILIRDVETGEILSRWEINAWSIAYSPRGRIIAAGSVEGSLHLWDVENKQEIARMQGHEGAVRSLAFSPDGTRIVSVSDDESVRLWDVGLRSPVTEFRGHDGPVGAVAFSPDGQWIASGGEDRTIRLWKPSQQQSVPKRPLDHQTPIGSVDFSPDGCQVVTASRDGMIGVWDTETGALSHRLYGHEKAVHQLYFVPGTRQLFSESDDSWHLWDLQSGEEIGHGESGHFSTLSTGGRFLAACSEGGTAITVSDTNSGEEHARLEQKAEVTAIGFSPDARRIATGSTDNTVRIWHVASGHLLHSLEGHTDTVRSVAFSPDGRRLVSGAGRGDDAARVWDLGEKNLIRRVLSSISRKSKDPGSRCLSLGGHAGASFDVHWPGQYIISCDAWRVRVWHADTGQLLGLIRYYQTEYARHFELGFSADGARVAVADIGRNYIWDEKTTGLGATGGTSAEKTLGHSEENKNIEIIYGRGDISAMAAGPEYYPYRALGRESEIVIESCHSGKEVSWLPVHSTLIRTHPCGSGWAVATGSQLRILGLEGQPWGKSA